VTLFDLALSSLKGRQSPACGLVGRYDPASIFSFPPLNLSTETPLVNGVITDVELVDQVGNKPLVLTERAGTAFVALPGRAEAVAHH
jgi:hypothetical protein